MGFFAWLEKVKLPKGVFAGGICGTDEVCIKGPRGAVKVSANESFDYYDDLVASSTRPAYPRSA